MKLLKSTMYAVSTVCISILLSFVILGKISIGGFNAYAQNPTTDVTLNQVNGTSTGCAQKNSVASTGANRSGPFVAGQRYIVYGYLTADISTGDALRCTWGDSSVDVTAIAGSKVGEVIYANQEKIFLVKTGKLYLSCTSKTGSGVSYDVCLKN